MKAVQQLKDEHEGIKLMLVIMEKISNDLVRGKDLNTDHYIKVLEFIKEYTERIHHGKEERILFPAMVSQGVPNEEGPMAVILKEHKLSRTYLKSLIRAFGQFHGGNKFAINNIILSSMHYVRLLRNHMEKENNILFMIADEVLDEEEQSKLCDAFEMLESSKMGKGKQEEHHRVLKELRSIYLDKKDARILI